jgi:hypothetical protein
MHDRVDALLDGANPLQAFLHCACQPVVDATRGCDPSLRWIADGPDLGRATLLTA